MSIEAMVEELTGRAPPPALLVGWLDTLSKADTCLQNYSAERIKLLKAYAVAHFMAQQLGGEIVSEKSPTGASVSRKEWTGKGTGLRSTRFGDVLLGMNGSDCIAAVIDKPPRFARSINPSAGRRY